MPLKSWRETAVEVYCDEPSCTRHAVVHGRNARSLIAQLRGVGWAIVPGAKASTSDAWTERKDSVLCSEHRKR